MATAPLAHTPRITVITELNLANSSGGRSSVRIQLYGVPCEYSIEDPRCPWHRMSGKGT